MWKHFLTAIGLLGIALMAALYSSSAGRDGRIIGAGVSAFIALAISIWVAVKFVPRMASNVDWKWLPFLMHYRVTREGWIYFAAVAVVVFAAVNTANNLLYMVLSALLAVLILSGFLSSLNFRLMRIAVHAPSECFVGEPFPISIHAYNKKRFFPAFSFHIEPADENAFQFSALYFSVVRVHGHTSEAGQAMIAKRGRYTMRSVRASSGYPFGFFLKHRNCTVEAECICYPEIIPQEEMNFALIDFQGSNQRFERGLGHDLYMIRDYVPSDSTRHVHWKASAKTSTLKTREYAAEESRRIVLAFDRFGHAEDDEQFEQLVSYAASVAFHLVHDGIEVGFVSDDWRSAQGNTQVVLESILQYLAVVKMSPSAKFPILPVEGAMKLSLRLPA